MNAGVRLNVPVHVPLQCPHCYAHGWVTLVTGKGDAEWTLEWRCTNCHHGWPAIQSVPRLDDRPVPDKLFVAGGSLSFDRLVKEVEAGLGAPMTVKSLGSFSDLDAAIKTRYAAEPANVP